MLMDKYSCIFSFGECVSVQLFMSAKLSSGWLLRLLSIDGQRRAATTTTPATKAI